MLSVYATIRRSDFALHYAVTQDLCWAATIFQVGDGLWTWKRAIQDKLADLRLTIHHGAQVMPVTEGIPWLGWIVWPHWRRLKARNAVNFTRRLEGNLDLYQAGQIGFAELDADVQGWINHVQYGNTWGLLQRIFSSHSIGPRRPE